MKIFNNASDALLQKPDTKQEEVHHEKVVSRIHVAALLRSLEYQFLEGHIARESLLFMLRDLGLSASEIQDFLSHLETSSFDDIEKNSHLSS